MDEHTISSMMFYSSIKCLPRQLTAELKERHVDACQELLKRFEAEELLREMKPGFTTASGNQESERGMAPYLRTKTEKIPRTTICGKGYADSLLG
jgi:hypothetical protein